MMAVSKRLRYEILRRDNHTCRYCGQSAPDVKLTVDHVVPTTLGGSDDPSNLAAACADCNSGKSATPPDAPLVADVERKAVQWAAAMRLVAQEREADREYRISIEEWFERIWNQWGYVPKADDWRQSIHQLLEAGLEFGDIEELVVVAMNCSTAANTFRYFCGCCWRRVRQSQERAAQLIQEANSAT